MTMRAAVTMKHITRTKRWRRHSVSFGAVVRKVGSADHLLHGRHHRRSGAGFCCVASATRMPRHLFENAAPKNALLSIDKDDVLGSEDVALQALLLVLKCCFAHLS